MIKIYCDICNKEITNCAIMAELKLTEKTWNKTKTTTKNICEVCHRKINVFLKELKDE